MKRVGELLREYMQERGWLEGNPYEPLFHEWEKIAGKTLAEHARLVDVQNMTLLIEVDHPGWLQMLQLRKRGLLEAARRTAPLVSLEDIKVRVGDARSDQGY
jgi:predicted nucleic acid-binding Zn ribbon protein